MTGTYKLKQETTKRLNIQVSKLIKIKYVDNKVQRKTFINMLNDFINFIRCSLK